MVRSKKIDQLSSVGKLVYIGETVINVSRERIETVVLSINRSNDIDHVLRIFSNLNNYFAGEEELLQENELTHNQQYANEDNGKYSTAYNALACMKHSVFCYYMVLNKFIKKKKPSYCYQSDTNDIEFKVEHSSLGKLPIEDYMFNDVTSRQERVIREINNFLDYFGKNIERCKKIVEEEEAIGKDENQCLVRLNRQIDEIYQHIKGHKIKKSPEQFVNELLSVDEFPAFAMKYWHKLKPTQLHYVAKARIEKKLARYTVNVKKAFDFDEEKICNFMKVVKTVMERYGKITGELMAYAQLYSNCTASNSAFYWAFSDGYSQLGGEQKIITYPGYNKSFKNYNDKNSDGYLEFERQMDLHMA